MSIDKKSDGVYKIRWWEGGRQKSVIVHGSFELAKKVHRKKLSARDENRHLDVKREINYRMSALIDRYWQVYGNKKKSHTRGKSVLDGIRNELGQKFVREGGWGRDHAVVRELDRETGTFGGDGCPAFQRHAPHDGESRGDLVQRDRN